MSQLLSALSDSLRSFKEASDSTSFYTSLLRTALIIDNCSTAEKKSAASQVDRGLFFELATAANLLGTFSYSSPTPPAVETHIMGSQVIYSTAFTTAYEQVYGSPALNDADLIAAASNCSYQLSQFLIFYSFGRQTT